MSAASIAAPVRSAEATSRSQVSPLPADLSHSPLLGILGVLLGAAVVTLTGRLLGLGLADLKGNVGIGFDEGSWIGTAFNVATMFIGPFLGLFGGIAGTATGATCLCVAVHCDLRISSSGAQLWPVGFPVRDWRINFWDVLSADPDVRTEQYSLAVFSSGARAIRLLH